MSSANVKEIISTPHLIKIYELVENYCMKTQKLNVKNPDIIFQRYTTIFHCCQQCLKDLIFCNKMIILQKTEDEINRFCFRKEVYSTDWFFYEALTCESVNILDNFCDSCLKYFILHLTYSDLHYIDKKFVA